MPVVRGLGVFMAWESWSSNMMISVSRWRGFHWDSSWRDVCWQECSTVYQDSCHYQNKTVCATEYESDCQPRYKQSGCRQVPREKCGEEKEKICTKVPERICEGKERTFLVLIIKKHLLLQWSINILIRLLTTNQSWSSLTLYSREEGPDLLQDPRGNMQVRVETCSGPRLW